MRWPEKIAHLVVMGCFIAHGFYALVVLGNPAKLPDWVGLTTRPLSMLFCVSAARLFCYLSSDTYLTDPKEERAAKQETQAFEIPRPGGGLVDPH